MGGTSRMKVAISTLAFMAALAGPSPSLAAEVAPGDVKITDLAVDTPIGQPGDPEAGAKAFKDGKGGNCLACHANKAMSKELFHGNVGPSLDGVATRYEPAQLRAILVNAKGYSANRRRCPASIHSRPARTSARNSLARRSSPPSRSRMSWPTSPR